MSLDTDTIENADEASRAETERYEKAYRETRRVLDESIEALAILEELEVDADMRFQISQKREALETARTDLCSANIAFHTGKATMRPPPPPLVNEIQALSKQAVELTVEKASAEAVLKLATSALNKFAEVQTI
ncbi:hypothetical protein [Niveibacterium microcysteis]|uniref:Uncharacterized protein n=1 Tax=Niveibacterium microcysteis TaxID=2811415 RepID=A0ABX7M0R7_9RHOO|nr:hypothetical protein [Niveibacterium microcysteis]QSI75350.1 hypothetical protein JY500_12590 [Niveibacterium microcysteis]